MSIGSRGHATRARAAGGWVAILVCLALAAPEAAAQLEVTSLKGVLRSGPNDLTLHSQVPEAEKLELGPDARCSILLAETALLQLSSRAQVTFGRIGESGPRRISLDRGELKATVGPRHVEGPLEIQAPEAIATLLGAVVHVVVDPETEETTVANLEGQVHVRSNDPAVGGIAILDAGEQLTVRRGGRPGEVRPFSRDTLEKTSPCLDDRSFRLAAVDSDRDPVAQTDAAVIAAADIPSEGLPLGAELSAPSALITALSKSGILDEVCDPISCNPVYRSRPPEPCPPGSPPGKQCP